MSLTLDQERLIVENQNLIYGILKQYNLLHKEDDISDWYGIAAEGLIKAAVTYKKGKSNFSTHAYFIMGNLLKNEMRYNTTQKQIPIQNITYLESIIPGTENVTYEEGIADKINIENYVCTNLRIKEICKELTPLQKKVIQLLITGYLPREIVDMGVCSKANIYKIIDLVKAKYNSY